MARRDCRSVMILLTISSGTLIVSSRWVRAIGRHSERLPGKHAPGNFKGDVIGIHRVHFSIIDHHPDIPDASTSVSGPDSITFDNTFADGGKVSKVDDPSDDAIIGATSFPTPG